MSEAEYRHYSPGLLPPIVAFWNEEFRDRRNFFPLTEELFEKRVVNGGTSLEKFAPEQLILACEGERVVGMMHALPRDEAVCRALFPDWEGGSQGVIAFFCVARERRGRGIGGELFRRAKKALSEQGQLAIDGQCLCPFYGNSSGPFTPFWGTPEGPSISGDDAGTERFLKAQGFNPRHRAVTLDTQLAEISQTELNQMNLPPDCSIELLNDRIPPLGEPVERIEVTGGESRFTSACCFRGGRAAGALVFFEMREAAEGRGAIYNFEVEEEARGLGVGRAVLQAALSEMIRLGWETCEVLTIPELSPAGMKLYEDSGFRTAAHWLVY